MSVKNLPKVNVADKSDFTQWIIENTEPGSTFLTLPTIQYNDNAVSNILMAGGKMYVHMQPTRHTSSPNASTF